MPLALDLISTLVMGVDFAGGDDALGEIALLHFGQLGGIDLGAASGRCHCNDHQRQHGHGHDGNDDPALLLVFAVFAVRHNYLPNWVGFRSADWYV